MQFNETYINTIGNVSKAASLNDVSQLRRLLSSGKSINGVDNRGWTALHHACAAGARQAVDVILQADDCDVNSQSFEGLTPLMVAISSLSSGKNSCSIVRVIRCLLKCKDVSVQATDNFGSTALHLAAASDHLVVVKWLVRRGAEVNAVNAWGETPLHSCIESGKNEDNAIADYLIHHGLDLTIKDERELTPLASAVLNRRSHLVQTIVQSLQEAEDADLLNSIVNARARGQPVLALVAAQHQHEVLRLLLDAGADPHNVSDEQRLPVHYAIMSGTPGIDQHLTLKHLLAVTSVETLRSMESPFELARKLMDWPIYNVLIEANLEPDQFAEKTEAFPASILFKWSTPLAALLCSNSIELGEYESLAKLLIEKAGSGISSGNNLFLPPLLSPIRSESILQLLINRGGQIPDTGCVLLLAADHRSVRQALRLVHAGVAHPEAFVTVSSLSVLRQISSRMTESDRRTFAHGVSLLVLMASRGLGTAHLKPSLVLKFRSFIHSFSNHQIEENFSEALSQLQLGPSSLRILSRYSVRRQLLKCGKESLRSRIEMMASILPLELREYLLFHDIEMTLPGTL